MATCVYIIANLAQLLSPFLPFSSEEVREMLSMDEFEWLEKELINRKLQNVRPLFERIDVSRIDDELAQLLEQSKNQQNK